MKDRYQAQAKRFIDPYGRASAYLRVIDREQKRTVLPETTVQLPPDERRADFNPVTMLFERGWIVETPFTEWEGWDWINGGRYTHDVRPIAREKMSRHGSGR